MKLYLGRLNLSTVGVNFPKSSFSVPISPISTNFTLKFLPELEPTQKTQVIFTYMSVLYNH